MKKKKKKLYCAFIDFAKAFDTAKSFKYKENKKGIDKFSPCLTPTLHSK
jgi:hypothetical protein